MDNNITVSVIKLNSGKFVRDFRKMNFLSHSCSVSGMSDLPIHFCNWKNISYLKFEIFTSGNRDINNMYEQYVYFCMKL